MELKEYGKVLKKKWWVIAICVAIACTVTGVYSYMFIKPVYQATTKIIVNKSDPSSSLNGQINYAEITANIMLINTYKEIIRTTAIMDQVVRQHPDIGLTPEQLIRRINVSSVNDSQVMTLSVLDPSYERAMKIVNAVAWVFQESIPNIMSVDNVTILDQAKPTANPIPVSVNPILNIVVAFIVSMMAGIGLVLLQEYLDDTVRTEQDVMDVIHAPVFGRIEKIRKRDMVSRYNTRYKQNMEGKYATLNQ